MINYELPFTNFLTPASYSVPRVVITPISPSNHSLVFINRLMCPTNFAFLQLDENKISDDASRVVRAFNNF